MPLMIEGFRKGVIKFAIITCRKPENQKGEWFYLYSETDFLHIIYFDSSQIKENKK
jgi:hypothetical protein